MSIYSAEQVGRAVTHWPALLEKRERRTDAAMDVIDLQAAVDQVLSDPAALTWAERNLMSGDECDPPKLTVCDVDTHREREFYPPASDFSLQVAILNAEAAAIDTWEQRETVLAEAQTAATYNKAVRVFRTIRRLANPPEDRRPLRKQARYGGACVSCEQPVFVGQWILISNGQLRHDECEPVAQNSALG